MSASVNSVVTVFQNIFSNHGSTLLNGILIITTIGGQSIIRKLTFSCPCAYPLNVQHSVVFIVGPSIALFIIGIMINTTTWKLVRGVCFRVNDTRHSWRTVIVYCVEMIVQSSVAPAAWLFVVFLDGGYYRCLMAAGFCDIATAPQCKNETVAQYYTSSKSYDTISAKGTICPHCICELSGSDGSYIEAQSQIFAWFLLIGFGLATLLTMCCTRMCDKYTLVQRQYVDMYKDEEKHKFDSVAKEHACQLAERNARAFFNQKDWSKRDWDWVSGVSEVNNPMFARLRLIAAEKTNTTMYTPLQLWNDDKVYRRLQCWHQYDSNRTLVDLLWKAEICPFQSDDFPVVTTETACEECACSCGIQQCASGAEPVRIIHKKRLGRSGCDCTCSFKCIDFNRQ